MAHTTHSRWLPVLLLITCSSKVTISKITTCQITLKAQRDAGPYSGCCYVDQNRHSYVVYYDDNYKLYYLQTYQNSAGVFAEINQTDTQYINYTCGIDLIQRRAQNQFEYIPIAGTEDGIFALNHRCRYLHGASRYYYEVFVEYDEETKYPFYYYCNQDGQNCYHIAAAHYQDIEYTCAGLYIPDRHAPETVQYQHSGTAQMARPNPTSAPKSSSIPKSSSKTKKRPTDYSQAERVFSSQRLLQLKEISKRGGSINSYDVMTYDEYYTKISYLPEKIAVGFRAAHADLMKGVKGLANDYPELKRPFIWEEVDTKVAYKYKMRGGNIILACKDFIYEVFSEGGEGSWLNIMSFATSTDPKYRILYAVYKIAMLQSLVLDEALLASMLEMHDRFREKQKDKADPLIRALIAGGGPSGMLALKKFFMSGMSVTLVEKRTKFVRNQVVILDTKWMIQLRLFLGTSFDKTFGPIGNRTKPGAYSEFGLYNGIINVKNLETALKNRLVTLAKFVVRNTKDEHRLHLIDGTTVDDIGFPSIDKPKYHIKVKTVKDGKPAAYVIYFDLLVCAGGANDLVRNSIIGIPFQETAPKWYGVGVLLKGETFRKIDLLPVGNSGPITSNYNDIAPYLLQQKFDDVIAGSTFLSDRFRAKYAALTKMIIYGFVKKKDPRNPKATFYTIDETIDLRTRPIQLRIFENNTTLFIGCEIPPILEELFADLEERKQIAANENLFVDLKARIDRMFFAAIAYHFISQVNHGFAVVINIGHHGELLQPNPQMLNFDPEPINASSFPLIQYALDKSAVLYTVIAPNGYPVTLVVVAVGDSAASPHFYSGSGMSTGRIGIESTAWLLKMYYKDAKMTLQDLVDDINKEFRYTRKDVLALGRNYVQPLSKDKKVAIAVKKMCDQIEQAIESGGRPKAIYNYQIISNTKVTPKQTRFDIEIGSQHRKYGAWVNEEGRIGMEDPKKVIQYRTLTKIVLKLHGVLVQ
ncbi:hypothetical protein Ddc_11697 [Ditylenchus destructor]|nr:hypothetical protein Ddc_11697 [Ditylenchus destructor]